MADNPNISKAFPHPILGNSDDIVFSTMIINAKGRMNQGNYEFDIIVDWGNLLPEYDELLESNKAEFSFMVECRETFYRRSFSSNSKNTNLSIPHDHLRGLTEITCYLTAEQDIDDISFENQSDEFDGLKFNIKKGDWMGVSNKIKQFIEPKFIQDYPEIKEHIFKFHPDDNLKQYYKVMEWSQHSIIIGIPKNYWDKFDAHNKDTFKYIYMYSIILPVLTEAIVKIQYGDQEDEFKDRKWYTVIEQEIEKMETNEENAHVIAQMLLDNPFSNFIEQLDYIDRTEVEEI